MSKADKLPTDKHGRLDLGKPQTHLNRSANMRMSTGGRNHLVSYRMI